MSRLAHRWAAAVVGVATVAGLLSGCSDAPEDTANGTGVTYDGTFYLISGAEVRPDKLGEALAESVPFQDTEAAVRAVTGVDPEEAVAVQVSGVPGSAAEAGPAWLLASPEDDYVPDPWNDPELSEVVVEEG